MKKTLIIGLLLVLAGCENSVSQTPFTEAMKLEPGLEDCRAYRVFANGSSMYVVRCPNSSTSANYRNGKTTYNSVTIDGPVMDGKL